MSHLISEISIQGIKSFASPQILLLRPLTLVFGSNGAGKSTLVRLPMLLLGSVRDGVSGLDLRAGGVEHGARVADIFPASGGVSTLRFQLGLNDVETADSRLGADIQRYTDGSAERLRVARVSIGEFVEELPWGAGPPTGFLGWVPPHWDRDIPRRLREGAEAIVHLGPFRTRPSTVFAIPVESDLGMGHSGEGAPGLLAADSLWGSGGLTDRVNRWYAQTFGIQIRVESQGQRAFLLMADLPEGGAVPFASLGSGMTQCLAAVVALALGAEHPGRLVCLEEPELHLHPAAHAPLGQLLVDTARLGRSTVLVETHSENLLLRVRRAVVKGDLRREDLGLYWVDRQGGESCVRELHIDEDGFVPDWPHGVFQEDIVEAREISRLLRGRSQS